MNRWVCRKRAALTWERPATNQTELEGTRGQNRACPTVKLELWLFNWKEKGMDRGRRDSTLEPSPKPAGLFMYPSALAMMCARMPGLTLSHRQGGSTSTGNKRSAPTCYRLVVWGPVAYG